MLSAPTAARPEHIKGTGSSSDRRRYKRVPYTLLGRFMRENRQEFTCESIDLSIGGVSLASDVDVEIGERIVVVLEELGRLEGIVARHLPEGFGIQFTATHRKRQKIAAQLTWLINKHELSSLDQRRPGHDRIALPGKRVSVVRADGAELVRNALDVSISGASIASVDRPDVGEVIMVERLKAKVVRHHRDGYGVEFAEIQDIEFIRKLFG